VKRVLGLSIVLALAPVAQAADVEAGKAKVATVCATSVSIFILKTDNPAT
jgi:hypothetical protein